MKRTQTLRVLSYVADWLIIAVVIAVSVVVGGLSGHRQQFSLSDDSIKYEYTGGSTISSLNLVILSAVLPAVKILGLVIFFKLKQEQGNSRNRYPELLHAINISWLGLALSISLAQIFTNALKVTIGRPRPDMLARCVPGQGAADPTAYSLSNSSICTQTDSSLLNDGFRSFPSGHSSMAFSGLAYLAFFTAWRLSLLDRKGYVWKCFVVTVPLLLASFIAASRILDNRHHAFDVLFGSALGIVTSLFAFQFYRPQLSAAGRSGTGRFADEQDETRPLSRGARMNSGSQISLASLPRLELPLSSSTSSPENHFTEP